VLRALGGVAALVVLGLTAAMLVLTGPQFGVPAVGAGSQIADPERAGVVADTQVDDGRQLYLQTCASCHGNSGEGSGVAPPLIGVGAAAFDFYLRTGRMPLGQLGTPPWAQTERLPDDQIAALVAYGATLGEGPAIPNVVATAGDLQRGWQLYMNNCSSCHGAAGAGGELAAGVVAPPLDRADEQAIAEAILIGPGEMPRFNLPQDDVNSIARFILYLREQPMLQPGGIQPSDSGPVAEGFIALLIGLGAMVLAARWVTRLNG
jgi:ubiquinol-cytochrome c reductase cytochrome c subunit